MHTFILVFLPLQSERATRSSFLPSSILTVFSALANGYLSFTHSPAFVSVNNKNKISPRLVPWGTPLDELVRLKRSCVYPSCTAQSNKTQFARQLGTQGKSRSHGKNDVSLPMEAHKWGGWGGRSCQELHSEQPEKGTDEEPASQ